MSPRLRTLERARPRRSHAERTAETRQRVIDAVVESIAEIGFQRTTAAEISRRAGVTWGAVQHHFGDKDGILMAVLEKSFERFAQALGAPGPREETLEARVALFVRRGWQHFRSSHYRSTLEILMNLPQETEIPWQSGMLEEWRRTWSRFFPESDPSQKASIDLMLYSISVFTGLATTQILEGRRARKASRDLAFLEDTLMRHLAD